MQEHMLEDNRAPPVILVVDSPLGTPNFRAYRVRQLIDEVTQTSFVRLLAVISILFKITQIGINLLALFLTRNEISQAPFRMFIVGYTFLTAAHTISFVARHWKYIITRTPLEFTQGSEVTLLNNLLDILTLFLYFIGFKWIQQYEVAKGEPTLLYNLTRIWVFYGIAVVLAPIFSIILILLLLNYVRPTLPVIEYMPGGKIREEDAQCTICLASYAEKDQVRRLPCKHHFHMECIDEWFGIDEVCSLCKRPINPLYDIAGGVI